MFPLLLRYMPMPRQRYAAKRIRRVRVAAGAALCQEAAEETRRAGGWLRVLRRRAGALIRHRC